MAAPAVAPGLKVVQKFGTLAANIDRAACAERGVAVELLHRHVNVAVAEQAFALMMALAKRIPELAGLVEQSTLEAAGFAIRPRASAYIGYSNFARIAGLKTLYGATLGIIGFGEVGREIARRAGAFGMTTLYSQRRPLAADDEAALGARYCALPDLMAQSDYVVVQLPLNETTRGIIDRKLLGAIKPGAVLVNCARAELIDSRGADRGARQWPSRWPWPRRRICGADRSGRATAEYPQGGNVLLMPHTAIAARHNALSDLEQLCMNLWRAIAS